MQKSHPSKRIREIRRAAAYSRWERARSDAEPCNPGPLDMRQPFDLLLSSAGGKDWRFEPVLGLIAWRQIDLATGKTEARAALKTLLRSVADGLPRTLSVRAL